MVFDLGLVDTAIDIAYMEGLKGYVSIATTILKPTTQ